MKRTFFAALLSAAVIMISGCVPHTELEKLGIAEAVGVDYSDGEYTVTVQFFNTDASGGVTAVDSSAPNATVESGSGRTIESALQAVSYTSGNNIMLGGTAVIIFGEDALFSLEESLDLAASHYCGNLRAYIAAARGRAEDVLNVKFTEGGASVEKLKEMMMNADELGLTRPVQLYEAMEKLCGETRSVALPLLQTYPAGSDSTEDGTRIIVAGGAFCANGRFAGELTPAQMSGLRMLDSSTGGAGRCELTLTYRGYDTRLMLYGIRPRITPQVTENALTINADITAECKIVSTGIPSPYRVRGDLEHLCEEEIKNRITSLLEATAAHGADVSALGYPVRAVSPELRLTPEILRSARFTVSASVSLDRYGVLK